MVIKRGSVPAENSIRLFFGHFRVQTHCQGLHFYACKTVVCKHAYFPLQFFVCYIIARPPPPGERSVLKWGMLKSFRVECILREPLRWRSALRSFFGVPQTYFECTDSNKN